MEGASGSKKGFVLCYLSKYIHWFNWLAYYGTRQKLSLYLFCVSLTTRVRCGVTPILQTLPFPGRLYYSKSFGVLFFSCHQCKQRYYLTHAQFCTLPPWLGLSLEWVVFYAPTFEPAKSQGEKQRTGYTVHVPRRTKDTVYFSNWNFFWNYLKHAWIFNIAVPLAFGPKTRSAPLV